jgi:hypothetical protein
MFINIVTSLVPARMLNRYTGRHRAGGLLRLLLSRRMA